MASHSYAHPFPARLHFLHASILDGPPWTVHRGRSIVTEEVVTVMEGRAQKVTSPEHPIPAFADPESVVTCEDTYGIRALVVGEDMTGRI